MRECQIAFITSAFWGKNGIPSIVQLQKKEEAHKEAVGRAVAATDHWMERFDVVVIGPGLGRDELVHDTVKEVCWSFVQPVACDKS